MEQSKYTERNTSKPGGNSGPLKRKQLIRTSLLLLLSSIGCSSPAPEFHEDVPSFWLRERSVHVPKSPWGENEALVTRTRENLTLYVHAVILNCPENRKMELLREVLHMRTEISHFERFYLGQNEADLPDFLKWLAETNQWAMRQRDVLE
jgi:hypothetical protein